MQLYSALVMRESDYLSLEYDHGDHEFDSEVVLFLLLSYHTPF